MASHRTHHSPGQQRRLQQTMWASVWLVPSGRWPRRKVTEIYPAPGTRTGWYKSMTHHQSPHPPSTQKMGNIWASIRLVPTGRRPRRKATEIYLAPETRTGWYKSMTHHQSPHPPSTQKMKICGHQYDWCPAGTGPSGKSQKYTLPRTPGQFGINPWLTTRARTCQAHRRWEICEHQYDWCPVSNSNGPIGPVPTKRTEDGKHMLFAAGL